MDEEMAQQVRRDLDEASCQFHSLLDSLSEDDWNAPSLNPAWTNGQLVYHMLFAFMLVPSLFWMIRFWSALPPSRSRRFAQVLNWSTPLFNRVNALGPRGQERVFGRKRAVRIFDRVHRSILRKVDSIPVDGWGRGMYYPRRWGRDVRRLHDLRGPIRVSIQALPQALSASVCRTSIRLLMP